MPAVLQTIKIQYTINQHNKEEETEKLGVAGALNFPEHKLTNQLYFFLSYMDSPCHHPQHKNNTKIFLSSSLFSFLWPHKWVACLSSDVAQAFQHDISIHMTIVDMEMMMEK